MHAPMIYIHVPFCRSFCTYCDFYSEIATDGLVNKYTEAVCAEIRARHKEIDPRVRKAAVGYLDSGNGTAVLRGDLSNYLVIGVRHAVFVPGLDDIGDLTAAAKPQKSEDGAYNKLINMTDSCNHNTECPVL